MRRFLVADDEYRIRQGLVAILRGDAVGATAVVECENGQDALDVMSSTPVDIAIIDIRMPIMDGLTAIKRALELDSPPAFIILSGHDDFEFARNAIRLGVHDYLLKPVDVAELIASIRRAEDQLDRDGRAAAHHAEDTGLVSTVFENELNYILLNRNLSDDDVGQILRAIDAPYLFDSYRLLSFELLPHGLDTPGEQTVLLDVVTHLASGLQAWAVCRDFEQRILIVVPSALEPSRIEEAFDGRFGTEYVVGMSAIGTGAGDLRRCYAEATGSRKHHMISCEARVILFEHIPDHMHGFPDREDEIRSIQRLIGGGRIDLISEQLSTIFDPDMLGEHGTAYFEHCIELINTSIIDYFARLEPGMLATETLERVKNGYAFENLDHYLGALLACITELNGYVCALKSEYQDTRQADRVLSWLEDNYANPNLSMGIVAEYAGLNYSYFSSVFREWTGVSFVRFLKKLRIDKARGLLDAGALSVREIAGAVGFQNLRLFTKTFREEVGMNPSEYSRTNAFLHDLR